MFCLVEDGSMNKHGDKSEPIYGEDGQALLVGKSRECRFEEYITA